MIKSIKKQGKVVTTLQRKNRVRNWRKFLKEVMRLSLIIKPTKVTRRNTYVLSSIMETVEVATM